MLPAYPQVVHIALNVSGACQNLQVPFFIVAGTADPGQGVITQLDQGIKHRLEQLVLVLCAKHRFITHCENLIGPVGP